MEGFGGKEKGSIGNSKKVELFSVVLLEIQLFSSMLCVFSAGISGRILWFLLIFVGIFKNYYQDFIFLLIEYG